ncbi:lipid II:glycine glycyltransferase FemX [Agrococcus beijingensis]|uniref:lipid II:glycine glycyltransferase FemX n=1 Tax=Agrococcus beijingensis TaxID=3068634 RepID=UPI002740E320|nr:GNAT family N-acetyltransferase [Agrococcus sp. REN33]
MSWTVRDATSAEIGDWDALVRTNPDGGQWTQSSAYAAVKRTERLHPRHLVLSSTDGAAVYALALEHRSLAGRFWYFASGPGAALADFPQLAAALRAATTGAAKGVYAVKVEPFEIDTPEHRAVLADAGFRAANPVQQNTYTVLVDLTRPVDEIFAGFKKSLRNHIRYAERNGYRVEKVEPGEATYRTMYELMQTVSGGKGVEGMKPYEYYRTLWGAAMAQGSGHFWFGYDGAHDGPQASAFMLRFGRYALAKDGGSVPDRAIRGGAHLIRWTAMQWFKEQGAEVYDAYATPPSWQADDTSHRLHGPGVFKRVFGPIVDHLPTHDLVLDAARYRLFLRLLLPIERRVRRRPFGIW